MAAESSLKEPEMRLPADPVPVSVVAGDRYEVVCCRSPEALAPYVAGWQRLAETATEPNIFYEPWTLLPAMRLYGKSRDIRVILICRKADAHAPREVVGVFPLEMVRRFRYLPIRCARLWNHPHCYLTTPLIASDAAGQCWPKVFAWLREQRVQLLEMGRVHSDSTQFDELTECWRDHGRPIQVQSQYQRPLLRLDVDAQTYLYQNLSAGVRQTLARKRRRLAECGELKVATLQPGDDLGPWLEDFLALEASGWKGDEGTAMACHVDDREYMATISREAHRRGRLSLVLLRLNGKAIAGLYNLIAGDGAFQIKVAYDEAWGRYSPGILAYMETVQVLQDRPGCQWIDSCVAPSNTAAKQVWKQHRQITDMVLAVGTLGTALLRVLPMAQELKRKVQRLRNLHWSGVPLLDALEVLPACGV